MLQLRMAAIFMVSLIVACGGGEETDSFLKTPLSGAKVPTTCQSTASIACVLRPSVQPKARPPALSAPSITVSAVTVFNWLPQQYPEYFRGGASDGSVFIDGLGAIHYRHWPTTGNYFVVRSDGSTYVYGAITSQSLLFIAQLEEFKCLVYDCVSGQLRFVRPPPVPTSRAPLESHQLATGPMEYTAQTSAVHGV